MLFKHLGLVVFSSALLTAVALLFKTTFIETDISGRVAEELQSKGYGWAVVRIDGRNVTLEGTSPNKIFSQSARQLAENVHGVHRVISKMNYVSEQVVEAAPAPAPVIVPSVEKEEYKTTIRFSLEKIELLGSVPSASIKKDIVRLAGQLTSTDRLVDDLRLNSDSPNNWRTVFGLGFSQLSRLESGYMTLTNNTLRLGGRAWSSAAVDSVNQILSAGLPDPYIAELDITTVPAGPEVAKNECQELINNQKSDRRIYFDTDSARIKRLSYSLLDRLSYTLMRCPGFKVKVEGHTDNRGPGERNWRLSKDRAESVKKYLVRSGLPERRIYTRGYGEARPIASNKEEAGRAANRRIELIITNQKFVEHKERKQ